MKRNRKAEAATKKRKLSKQQAELRRISILLTELEAASSLVLLRHFDFTEEQVHLFLQLVRNRFQAIRSGLGVFSSLEARLKVVAQRFGLAAMQILVEFHGFDSEKTDQWLKLMIQQGNQNRATETPALGQAQDATEAQHV